jgi:hypothetical protein
MRSSDGRGENSLHELAMLCSDPPASVEHTFARPGNDWFRLDILLPRDWRRSAIHPEPTQARVSNVRLHRPGIAIEALTVEILSPAETKLDW